MSQKKIKQRIKCPQCGKKTVQQEPQKYNNSFYCPNCDAMYKITKKESEVWNIKTGIK